MIVNFELQQNENQPEFARQHHPCPTEQQEYKQRRPESQHGQYLIINTHESHLGHSRSPGQHDDDHDDVHQSSVHEQGGATNNLDDVSTGKGEAGVADTKDNDNTTNDFSSIGAGEESLEIFYQTFKERADDIINDKCCRCCNFFLI